MNKILVTILLMLVATISNAQMGNGIVTKDGRSFITTTSAPNQSVVMTNVSYLQTQTIMLGTNAAVSNWPSAGTASTTLIVTQDWVYVENTNSGWTYSEADFPTNSWANPTTFSFASVVPVGAKAVLLNIVAFSAVNQMGIAFMYNGDPCIQTYCPGPGAYFGIQGVVPLTTNRTCTYVDYLTSQDLMVRVMGWYIPKTTTYNLPAGGIGTITNGNVYVQSGFNGFQLTQTNFTHDGKMRPINLSLAGVPLAATMVEAYAVVSNNATGLFRFNNPAETNYQYEFIITPQVAGMWVGVHGMFTVSNGIAYYFSNLTNPEVDIRIKGWWMPQVQAIAGNAIGGTVVSGAVPMAVNSSGSVAWSTRLSPLTGMKNRIINGDFKVWQRGTNLTLTGANAGAYLADRWSSGYAATTLPTMRIDRVTSAGCPDLEYAYKITAAPKAATSDFRPYTYQQIEGYNVSDLMWGTASALPVTISFWVKGTLSGSYGLCLADGAWTKTYVTDYVINQANVWENKTLTIPGCTNGVAWYKDSSVGLGILFDLGAGTGNTEKAGTNNVWCDAKYASTNTVNFFGGNNSLYLTGVQLEKGSIATDFEFRSYGQEFTLCQRYYEVIGGLSDDLSGATCGSSFYGYGNATTYAIFGLSFMTQKRTTPVITKNGTWNTGNCSQPAFMGVTKVGFRAYIQITATGSYACYADSADDAFEIKAEY